MERPSSSFHRTGCVCPVRMCLCVCVCVAHVCVRRRVLPFITQSVQHSDWVLWCLHPERWEVRGLAERKNVSDVSHEARTNSHFVVTTEGISCWWAVEPFQRCSSMHHGVEVPHGRHHTEIWTFGRNCRPLMMFDSHFWCMCSLFPNRPPMNHSEHLLLSSSETLTEVVYK